MVSAPILIIEVPSIQRACRRLLSSGISHLHLTTTLLHALTSVVFVVSYVLIYDSNWEILRACMKFFRAGNSDHAKGRLILLPPHVLDVSCFSQLEITFNIGRITGSGPGTRLWPPHGRKKLCRFQVRLLSTRSARQRQEWVVSTKQVWVAREARLRLHTGLKSDTHEQTITLGGRQSSAIS